VRLRRAVARATTTVRSQAKTAVLGLVYGIGPAEMAGKLGIPEEEALRIRGAFLATYPGIRAFMANAKAFAARHGAYVVVGRTQLLQQLQVGKSGRQSCDTSLTEPVPTQVQLLQLREAGKCCRQGGSTRASNGVVGKVKVLQLREVREGSRKDCGTRHTNGVVEEVESLQLREMRENCRKGCSTRVAYAVASQQELPRP